MIRVLIVDDSPVAQRVLSALLESEPGIEVIGTADNGLEAIEKCRVLKPDLITMDIFMPVMDGIEATRQIMEESPTRIVIVSSMVSAKEELRKSFTAVHFGAIEVVAKPHGALSGDYRDVQETIARVVAKMMDADPNKRFSWMPAPWEKKRGKNRPLERRAVDRPVEGLTPELMETAPGGYRPGAKVPVGFGPRVICFGGSTGAPAVLLDVLSSLPGDYPIPIVVGQHIARGFVAGMVEWLNREIALDVELAVHGMTLRPGRVIVAPDDKHLQFNAMKKGSIDIVPGNKTDLCVPSIDRMFDSAARVYGFQCAGLILSGMGRDGASGLLRIRKSGGVTIAQNEETSVVYGMPREACLRNAVVQEMTPPEMVAQLLMFARGRRGRQ